jgi:hypothetical protein
MEVEYGYVVDGDDVEITKLGAVKLCDTCRGRGRVVSRCGLTIADVLCPECASKGAVRVIQMDVDVLDKNERLGLEQEARDEAAAIDRDNEEQQLRERADVEESLAERAETFAGGATNDDGQRGGGNA